MPTKIYSDHNAELDYADRQERRHVNRTPRHQNNAAREDREPTIFTIIEENNVGRIVECSQGRNTWWAVHLWDRPDKKAFTIEGVYQQVSSALAALANA